jgi:hypothetical protein
MIALLFAASLAQAEPPFSDAQACEVLTRLTTQENSQPSRQIDAITRSGGSILSCHARTLTMNKIASIVRSAGNPDWTDREQAHWNNFVCNGPGFGVLARHGWRLSESFLFADGERVTFEAHCPAS